MGNTIYKRLVVKISGEALSGQSGQGICPEKLAIIADEIISVAKQGVEVGIVIGAGNIWRGRQGKTMDRATADYMGMLATVINSLAMQDALEQKGYQTRVMTAIAMNEIAEPYIRRKAMSHLRKKLIVIFACGTGNPYFSTDTTAALRAAEVEADAVLFAKNIDGVYTADPRTDCTACRYKTISYQDMLEKNIQVMDSTAAALLKDNQIPLQLFAINERGNILRAVMGEPVGTVVSGRVTTEFYKD